MYGKIFDSIYDGTLRANWKALVTFQQMIVLSDADGVVDMTPEAIHGRTGIPLDIINEGIKHLSKPDPHSRTLDEDGCRIKLLDDHRPWGWYLVNHHKYKSLQDSDTVREQNRIRKKRQRERHASSRTVVNSHTKSRHTDTDTDTDKSTTAASRPPHPYSPEFEMSWFTYPNRAGSNPKNRAYKAWCARIKEGVSHGDIQNGVIRYGHYCGATGKLNTEYVMQSATFFGPDKHYENPWTIPTGGKCGSHSHADNSAPARVARAAAAQRIS